MNEIGRVETAKLFAKELINFLEVNAWIVNVSN